MGSIRGTWKGASSFIEHRVVLASGARVSALSSSPRAGMGPGGPWWDVGVQSIWSHMEESVQPVSLSSLLWLPAQCWLW